MSLFITTNIEKKRTIVDESSRIFFPIFNFSKLQIFSSTSFIELRSVVDSTVVFESIFILPGFASSWPHNFFNVFFCRYYYSANSA